MTTVAELLETRASERPGAIALLSTDGRLPVTYSQLADAAFGVARSLRALGIDRTSRIAISLPNGRDLAGCLLGTFLAGECAPLNPAYSEREFGFYLADLEARLLIAPAAADSPARLAAERLGIRVVEPASLWGLPYSGGSAAGDVRPGPEDVALVLHTSGTTSRPKLVPLTHRNICTSASNIRLAFALTPADRCLQVMPLFHVHGIVGALLSSLTAGASVVCAPGFDAGRFFWWLEEFRPTWYTAVPTIHRAVLAGAGEVRDHALRFIRSCSSPLAPAVMSAMERAFGVPVIESYGMTEGAHQIASNPLPPRVRKPGSVGQATGTEVAILDEVGEALGPGESGEVAIRGVTVTSGYADTLATFAGAWLRTGDRGYLDQDGYLFLSGRLKEMINRGGEKISPREIDEALLEHPEVAEALAFAIPDPLLGEEVGAAVVLKPGAAAGVNELREHTAARLAYFKIPRRIVILGHIPKGPTGKPQRIGLAAKLGLAATAIGPRPPQRPLHQTEEVVRRIWREVLRKDEIGPDDNFFDLGGDSLRAAQVIARTRELTGAGLTLAQVFAFPTIAQMARHMEPKDRGPAIPVPAQPRQVGSIVPLSFAQESLWLLSQIQEDDAPAIRPFLFRFHGGLSVSALESAIRHIVERHEVLRTRIVAADGIPVGIVDSSDRFRLGMLDISGSPQPQRRAVAERMVLDELRAAFDLAGDLPVRSALARISDDESLFGLAMHHACSDGWSDAIFARELSVAYRALVEGAPPRLAEMPLQYADYASWQRDYYQGATLEARLVYWRRQLDGLPRTIRLPYDRPRPARPGKANDCCRRFLEERVLRSVETLGRAENATPFMVLLAALFQSLHRWSGESDLVIGTPAANRPTAGAEQIIGLFANPLLLRCQVTGDLDFRRLLRRVRDLAIAAFEREDVPLDRVAEALRQPRDRGFHPLYRIGFQWRNLPAEAFDFPGVTVERMPVDRTASFIDLSLEATEAAGGIHLTLDYSPALFDRLTVERMLSEYVAGIERIGEEARETVRKAAV